MLTRSSPPVRKVDPNSRVYTKSKHLFTSTTADRKGIEALGDDCLNQVLRIAHFSSPLPLSSSKPNLNRGVKKTRYSDNNTNNNNNNNKRYPTLRSGQKINSSPIAPSFGLPNFPMEEDPTRLLAVPIGFELLCSEYSSPERSDICAKPPSSHALTARPSAREIACLFLEGGREHFDFIYL